MPGWMRVCHEAASIRPDALIPHPSCVAVTLTGCRRNCMGGRLGATVSSDATDLLATGDKLGGGSLCLQGGVSRRKRRGNELDLNPSRFSRLNYNLYAPVINSR
jgi:hypothetical protein